MADILTRKDVADFFKLPIRTVDYLVSTGQIPFSRIGNVNRLSKMTHYRRPKLTHPSA